MQGLKLLHVDKKGHMAFAWMLLTYLARYNQVPTRKG